MLNHGLQREHLKGKGPKGSFLEFKERVRDEDKSNH